MNKRCLLLWIFLLFSTESHANASVRSNYVVELCRNYGLTLPHYISLNQRKHLNPNFFLKKFQIVRNLTTENIESYSREFPRELWALNKYLTQLYRQQVISASYLGTLRESSVKGVLLHLKDNAALYGDTPVTQIKKSLPFELQKFLLASKDFLTGIPTRKILKNHTENALDKKFSTSGQEFLNDFSPTSAFSISQSLSKKPIVSYKALFPISENQNQITFSQISLIKSDNSLKGSLGVGRRLIDLSGNHVIGLNSFLDFDTSTSGLRGSVGGEILNNLVSARANYYFSLTDFKDYSDTLQSKPSDGFDASLFSPIPYLQNTNLSLNTYRWEGSFGQSDQEFWSIGIDSKIASNFELSIEHVLPKSSGSSFNRASIKYFPKIETTETPNKQNSLLKQKKYALVQRDESIPLSFRLIGSTSETSSSSSSSTTNNPSPSISACDGRTLTTYENTGVTLSESDIVDPSTQFYLPATGSIYEVVVTTPLSSDNPTWTEANNFARSRNLGGLRGHLPTITSAEEQSFLDSLGIWSFWTAGSDAAQEGCFEWTDGPEAGQTFATTFEYWHDGQPDEGSPESQDYVYTVDFGTEYGNGWRDWDDSRAATAYVIEYSSE